MGLVRKRAAPSDKLLAFAFGVIFVAAILAITILIPNPTRDQSATFRIVLALAAAGVGAVLPGFLEVSFREWLRAGGAMAMFAIVYFFAPAAVPQTAVDAGPPPTSEARPVAQSWLALVDSGDYDKAYSNMSPGFRATTPLADAVLLFSRFRQPLGRVIERELETASPTVNPAGALPGHYMTYVFRSKFERDPRPIYEVVTLRGDEGEWRVGAIYLAMKNSSGEFVPYEASSSAETSNTM